MDDYFRGNLKTEIKVEVECPNGHEFDFDIYYNGYEFIEKTVIRPYRRHVWLNREECPKCYEECEVKLVAEERMKPLDSYFENSNCEVLNEKEILNKVLTPGEIFG